MLREALALGVNHIDTSDFYGPHVTNQIIREAIRTLTTLTIVTKIGARRGGRFWLPAFSPAELQKRYTIIYVISARTYWMWLTCAL